MAEFQEVMREWVRARKAINENELSCYPLEMFTDDHIANIEKEVMAWAAEHPVVYPTWGEWLMSIGVINGVHPHGAIDALGNLKQPIHADLAQKLGLQPKE